MAEPTAGRRREPAPAILLTLLTPGLGHVYAGVPTTGIKILLAVFVVLDAAIALSAYLPLGAFDAILLIGVPLGAVAAAAIHARRACCAAPSSYALRRYNRWYVYVGLVLTMSYVVYPANLFLVRTFVAQAYRNPSTGMAPTLLVDDFFYVKNFLRRPRALSRGQVIVFESVSAPGVTVIKRITGVAGDRLEMRRDTLLVNGVAQIEPYTQYLASDSDVSSPEMRWQVQFLAPGVDTSAFHPSRSSWGPLIVPAGAVFVMGDNRYNSYDSRYYGFVPVGRVRGRPLRVYYSYDPDSYRALAYFTAVRWSRIGQAVR